MPERELIKRADKKAFWGVPGEGEATFTRMRGFTELSGSKNPIEYSRQYVDEQFESTDVIGYSPSWSFAFDEFTNDAVLTDIVDILDGEKLGTDAQREIVFVDFSKAVGGGFKAVKRTFAVIGDSEADGSEAYTYSGNLRVVGSRVDGVATIADGEDADSVQTITFAEGAAE